MNDYKSTQIDQKSYQYTNVKFISSCTLPNPYKFANRKNTNPYEFANDIHINLHITKSKFISVCT